MRDLAAQQLLRELPPIRRARGFHLYTDGGTRYLDLYQIGGRAVLGHRPHAVGKEMKGVLSQGLLGQLPSVYEWRARKAIGQLLPEHPYVRLMSALPKGAEIPLWRPFDPGARTDADELLPVLPLPASLGPLGVCSRRSPPEADREGTAPGLGGYLPGSSAEPSVRTGPGVDEGELFSPVLLAGLARATHELLRAGTRPEDHFVPLSTHPKRGRGPKSGLSWQEFSHPLWQGRGPYLWPTLPRELHPSLFRHFLGYHILISPDREGPTILPRSWSHGEYRVFLEASDAALRLGEG
jgi:hypothetical protein